MSKPKGYGRNGFIVLKYKENTEIPGLFHGSSKLQAWKVYHVFGIRQALIS
ncbi:MAG: hypothetical protein Tsb009_23890 [Planctomycetaceae bacterium]